MVTGAYQDAIIVIVSHGAIVTCLKQIKHLLVAKQKLESSHSTEVNWVDALSSESIHEQRR